MAHRESDDSLEQESSKLKSEFNRAFVYSRVRTALLLLLGGMLMSVGLANDWLGVFIYLIPFGIFLLYLSFTLSHLYLWEFGQEEFSRRNILKRRKQTYKFSEISSWQERERFGMRSRRETIPNYEEINIWMKNKESFAFDAIDFDDYLDMKAFFLERCGTLGIEMAPYRE